MTPAQARAFLAVAIEGSFTAGAKRLNVSQPTVTSQVRAIERQYKIELFHRAGRGASLTSAGSALLPIVRRMFASFDEATAYLHDVRGLRQGHLRVGSYTPHGFMTLVARHKQRFPATSISVEFANSRLLASRILNYELDVAVVAREYAGVKFHALPVASVVLVVISPKRSAWARRASISVEDLRQQVVVVREPGSSSRRAFDQLIGTPGLPASQVVQIGSREGVIGAVAEGTGLGVMFNDEMLPQSGVAQISIDGSVTSSNDDLVCLAERRSNPLISGFLEVAREYLQERRSGGRTRSARPEIRPPRMATSGNL
jgi:LysR family transcriptional regulator, low CO2-responsive transcriptional regulator